MSVDVTKHTRILSWIYLVVSVPVFAFAALVCWYAGTVGGEGGLIFLPAAVVAIVAAPVVATGIGLRLESRWGSVLSVACGTMMLPSVLFLPLGAYSLYVAWLRWRTPAAAVERADPAPAQVVRSAAARGANLAWLMDARPHTRILGSLYLLVALLPLAFGPMVIAEWIDKAGRVEFASVGVLTGLGLVALGIGALAIAGGLLRQRRWAVWLSLAGAALLAREGSLGGAIALYTVWVAWITLRPGRAAATSP